MEHLSRAKIPARARNEIIHRGREAKTCERYRKEKEIRAEVHQLVARIRVELISLQI